MAGKAERQTQLISMCLHKPPNKGGEGGVAANGALRRHGGGNKADLSNDFQDLRGNGQGFE